MLSTPSRSSTPGSAARQQHGRGRSRGGDGQASQQRRNELDPVAIVNQNEHAELSTEAFRNMLVRVNPTVPRPPRAGYAEAQEGRRER
jgi:hypothetical protein